MIACAYCEHPLTCAGCQAEYLPPSPEHYEALGRGEVALTCAVCERALVCHWCKTPYDGLTEDEAGE